jgi:hypothetical protein
VANPKSGPDFSVFIKKYFFFFFNFTYSIKVFAYFRGYAYLRMKTTGLLYQSRLKEGDECRVAGRMRISSRNRSTRRKPAPIPFCPLQISQDLTRARTRAAVVGSWGLTAWAMARTLSSLQSFLAEERWDSTITNNGVLHSHVFQSIITIALLI